MHNVLDGFDETKMNLIPDDFNSTTQLAFDELSGVWNISWLPAYVDFGSLYYRIHIFNKNYNNKVYIKENNWLTYKDADSTKSTLAFVEACTVWGCTNNDMYEMHALT